MPFATRGLAAGIGFTKFYRTGTPSTPPAAFTMSQLASPNRIYQRNTLTGGGQGKGQGSVPVTLSAVTTAGTVYARCSSGGATRGDLQASFLGATLGSTGAQTATINGIDARLGWFFLDLSGDGVTWQNGTTPIGMGVLMLMAGQSLMVRNFLRIASEDTTTITAAGATINANNRLYGSADGNTSGGAWISPADGTTFASGAGAAQLGNQLVGAAGVNVGLVCAAVGQTAIASWQSGQTNGILLANTMAGAGNKFEIVWWYQGHSDADKNVSTYSSYQTALTSLFTSIASNNNYATPVKLLSSIPNINSANFGTQEEKETIRRASAEWANANGGIPVLFNDLQMTTDGVHPLQTGGVRQANHAYRALRTYFGLSNNDIGVTLGTPTHGAGSQNIVIPRSAGTLTSIGSPATRFKVYLTGDHTSPLALDATTPITVNTNDITLKLSADPGQVGLDVLPFGTNDTANDGTASLLTNTVTDGDGITYGRQLYPSPTPLRVTVNRDLTLSSATFGAGGKFGNTMTAGRGYTTASVLPSSADGFRVEGWCRVDVANGTKVFFGAFGGGVWVGCSGTDLTGAIGSSNFSQVGTFADLGWHHIAVTVVAPGIVSIHVDGVLIQAPAGYGGYNGAGGLFGVRDIGQGGYQLTTQRVDEVAIWRSVWPSTIVPTAAYAGTEPGLIALWHIDSNGTNSATTL